MEKAHKSCGCFYQIHQTQVVRQKEFKMEVVKENGVWVFRSKAGITDSDSNFDRLLAKISKIFKNASSTAKDEMTKAFDAALARQ